jgi:hypothetical protein
MQEVHPLEALTKEAAVEWVKQRVTNVIRSYHNAADVIAEPIQNAVDEVLSADGIGELGVVRVVLDTDENKISVRDNGRGIPSSDIAKYLAPDIGSKRADFLKGLVRGHKGVGLTFLAYGFNFFTLESRTESEHYVLRLEGGRTWVESDSSASPPVGTLIQFGEQGAPAPRLTETGTIVTVGLSPVTEPKNLRMAFPSADYAAVALQNQTAIGLIEPPAVPRKRELEVNLEYHAHSQMTSVKVAAHYRYPHMNTPGEVKTLDLGRWRAQNRNTEPQAKDRKAYHACYQVYGPEELAQLIGDRHGEKFDSAEELSEFIDSHAIHVYCLFSYSASYRDQIRSAWNVPANRKAIYSPLLRIATDGMISSWSREIALTHRGFNVDRTWLVYNFRNIEPDLGRKDFPPAVRDFIALSEEVVANEVANNSRPFLRISPPRGGGPGGNYESPQLKAFKRRQTKLSPSHIPEFGDIRLETEPASENDVIALFSELVGLGVLVHYRPVFYSGFDYYDSYFAYNIDVVPALVQEKLPGVVDVDERDLEGVAEFKFNADSLIEDTVAGVKRWNEMKFLICWDTGKLHRQYGGDEITFDPPVDAHNRRYAGITHLARLQSGGDHTVFVLSIKDFLKAMASDDQ